MKIFLFLSVVILAVSCVTPKNEKKQLSPVAECAQACLTGKMKEYMQCKCKGE